MKQHKGLVAMSILGLLLLLSSCVTHVHDRGYGYGRRRHVVSPRPTRVIVVPSHEHGPPGHSRKYRKNKRW